MPATITLYHGTISAFDEIDVAKGKWNKDFGRGFYTSRDVRHAERLAVRNKHIEQERFRLRGIDKDVAPWLYVYELGLDKLPGHFFFGTQRVADLLRLVERREIR